MSSSLKSPEQHPVRLLTLVEVARLLGVSRRTLNEWIAEGRMPIVQIGPRTPRVLASDIEKFIQNVRAWRKGGQE